MKFSREWFENTENRNEPTRFSREWFQTGGVQPQSETPKTPTLFETATSGAQHSVQTPTLSATQQAMQTGKSINLTDEIRANDEQFVSYATQGGKLFNTAVADSKPADLNYAETAEIRAYSERRRKLQSAQQKAQQADLETRNTFYYLWAKDGEDAALNWLNDADGQQEKYQKTKANNARASVYAGMKNAEDFVKQTESGREQFQAYMQNVKAANRGENVTAESTGMTYVGHEGFEEALAAMTPDERNTFYYVWAKGGAQRAKDYLDFLRDNPDSSINKAITQGMVDYAKEVKEMKPGFDKALAYVTGAASSGMSKAILNTPQLFTDEEINTRSIDAFDQEMTKDMSYLGKLAYGAVNSVGGMLPYIGASILTGNPIVGAGMMGLSSGGGAMNEMLKQGYSAGQARTYGALVGASEALMQYFLGGISKLGGGNTLSQAAINNLSHIDNALVRYIGTMGINIASEVGEEELQLFLEPLIKAAVTGEEYDAPTWQSMVDTAISTAISTGILELGNTTAYNSSAANTKTPEQIGSEAIDAVYQQTSQSESKPIKVGRATKIKIPYKGAVPHSERNVQRNRTKIDAAHLNTAKETMRAAEIESKIGTKSFSKYVKDVYRKILGSKKSIGVNGLYFGNDPYVVDINTGTVVGKIVSDTGLSAEKLSVFGNIEEVVKNGEYVGSSTYIPKNNKVKKTERFDHFESLVEIVDENGSAHPYIVLYEVEVFPTSNNYKRHIMINEIDLVPLGETNTGIKNPALPQEQGQSDNGASPVAPPVYHASGNTVNTETAINPFDAPFQQAQQGADIIQQAMQPTQGQSLGDVDNRDDVLRLPSGKKKSQTKTLPHYEQVKDVPDESRQPIYYDSRTEEESFTGAYQRFSQDRQAQVERLKNSNNWSGEDNDISLLELEARRREAMESGNWDAYNEWREIDTLHGGTEVAQSLQARAKRKRISGAGVVQLAAEALDAAKQGTDTNEVLTTVSEYGEEYDRAVASRSVDDLVSIIKDTSKERKTGSFRKNELSKNMDWAINRVAEYARSEIKHGQTNGKYFEFLRDFAASGIVNIATDTQKVDIGKALKTIRRNSMLSKASTILRNLVGNGVFDLTDSVSVNMAVPVDILLSKFTGTRSTAVDKSVFSSEKRKGQLDGLAMATMAVGLDVDPEGMASKYENTGNRTFKMSGNTMSRLMSTWEKYMGYALTATDEYAKGGISAETQRGIDKLYERGLIKDESLRDASEQMALYRTFQQDGVLSDISLGIRNAANKAKIFGRNIPVGDFVFPFVKTPSNLGQAAIDYSPVGIANGIVQTAKVLKDAKNGKLTAAQQAKAVQALGRGINGTALIAAFAALAKAGIVHILGVGDDDENKDRVAAEKMRGLNGTQWNLSATLRWARGESTDFRDDDILLNIGFLEPLNAQMTIGALIAEDAKDGLTFREAGLDVLSGVVQSVLDLPVMQSLKNVADSYRYSAGENEGEKLIDAGLQFAAETATSFIPNSIAGIAKGIDPYERDVYSGEGIWERTRDSALSKIPFARQTLPAKLDSFGNEVTTGNPVLNFIDNNINPGSVDTYQGSVALDEIDRIFGATNDASVYPSRQAPKAIEGSALTPEQKRKYVKASGGQYEENIDALMQNADYDRISPELQRDALKYAENIAAEAGKQAAGVGYKTDTKWIDELFQKNASEKEIADAIISKAIENSLGSGAQKWDDLGEMHERGEVSTAIAVSLLPQKARNGWERYGGYFSSVNQLLDAVQYYNSKDAEGTKDANGKTVKGESKQDKFNRWLGNTGWSEEQKQAAWLCFYDSLDNYRGW